MEQRIKEKNHYWRSEDKRTEESRKDDTQTVEEANDDKRQAERRGKLSSPVAGKDGRRAQRVLDVREALPDAKGNNKHEAKRQGNDDALVTRVEIRCVDDWARLVQVYRQVDTGTGRTAHQHHDTARGEEHRAHPVEAS